MSPGPEHAQHHEAEDKKEYRGKKNLKGSSSLLSLSHTDTRTHVHSSQTPLHLPPPPLFHSHGGQKFSSHFLLPPSVFPLSEWQWRLQAATIIVNESYSRKVDNENDFQLFAVLKLLYSRNRIMLILSPLTVCWRVCRYKRRPSARASLFTFNLCVCREV